MIRRPSQPERPFVLRGIITFAFFFLVQTAFGEPDPVNSGITSQPPNTPTTSPTTPADDLADGDKIARGAELLSTSIQPITPITGPATQLIQKSGFPREVLDEILAGAPTATAIQDIQDFPQRYLDFVKLLNAAFADKVKYPERKNFIRAIERNRFQNPSPDQPKDPSVGRFEAKTFNNRVVVRFVTGENTSFPKSIIINPDHGIDANEGIRQFSIDSAQEREPQNSVGDDPEISVRQLDTYRSRHMVNRELHGPLKIISTLVYRIGSGHDADLVRNLIGEPYKGFYYIQLRESEVGETSWTPAVESMFSKRYWHHRVKGTIEKLKYSNYVLGSAAGGIELITGMTFVTVAHLANPEKFALNFISPVIWAAYSFFLSTNADAYNRTVELGNNRFWQATKRLVVSAVPSYLCLLLDNFVIKGMPIHEAFASLGSLQSTFLILAVGFGDRYLSTVMNVGPKIQQRFFLKPWWFEERVPTPGREFVAEKLGRPHIKEDTMKGVSLTREVLAKIRFPFKFGALFLDASMMSSTTIHVNGVELPVPVASLMLWVLGIPFEIFNYFYINRVVKEEPAVKEELDDFRRSSMLRWFFPKEGETASPAKKALRSVGRTIDRCEVIMKSFAASFRDSHYPPY